MNGGGGVNSRTNLQHYHISAEDTSTILNYMERNNGVDIYKRTLRSRRFYIDEYLQSSIDIANASLEAIRVDSRRNYGNGK